MERHFEKELNNLKATLGKMAGLAQESLVYSTRALLEEDKTLAERCFVNERTINNLEIEIDHGVADFFALFQPVAIDLRFMLAIQKINNDLERIGDHCINIAQSSISVAGFEQKTGLLELPKMIAIGQTMLHDACESFFTKNLQLARAVLETDDMIDELNRANTREAIQLVKNDKTSIEMALELLRISRNLERIGDLSTNIAEEVIFHVQARVVKHHADDRKSRPAPPDEEKRHEA
ncbi:MAG: phoU 2 [Fibrobacteres bacterium]|nr:phoU 2 [Fibrobacterota bacterium]